MSNGGMKKFSEWGGDLCRTDNYLPAGRAAGPSQPCNEILLGGNFNG